MQQDYCGVTDSLITLRKGYTIEKGREKENYKQTST